MNIIFQINGGIGKCIAASAVFEGLKKKYPEKKLIVVSGYPDVFINNPNVDRCFAFGQMSYFYNEYIEDKDALIYAHDPYQESNHIYCREHLIETWYKMLGLQYDNEMPKIYLTHSEINFYASKYASQKPILLMQTNGGGGGDIKYSWARDLPSAAIIPIINHFKNTYNIVHIKREDQTGYQDTIPLQDNFRSMCVLISLSSKRLLIDSFAQHAAAALNKPSSVCWIVNKPNVFGYDMHNNILSEKFTKKPELRTAYFNKFNIGGEPSEFPYENENEIFNVEKIIKSIELQ